MREAGKLTQEQSDHKGKQMLPWQGSDVFNNQHATFNSAMRLAFPYLLLCLEVMPCPLLAERYVSFPTAQPIKAKSMFSEQLMIN